MICLDRMKDLFVHLPKVSYIKNRIDGFPVANTGKQSSGKDA
jgi:hypothetical protein